MVLMFLFRVWHAPNSNEISPNNTKEMRNAKEVKREQEKALDKPSQPRKSGSPDRDPDR